MTIPTITKANVVAIAPELSSETDQRFALVIGMASRRVGYYTQMQPVYTDAISLLAAHLLTMFRRGAQGGVGAITQNKAGEMQQQFEPFLNRNAFQQTVYGAEYWQLVQSFQVNPLVI